MFSDNGAPTYCRFCEMWLNIGQWSQHREGKKHRKNKKLGWRPEERRMEEAKTMLTEFITDGGTHLVVKARMLASGKETDFRFPSSDAPLWILQYAIMAWVLDMYDQEEHLFIGVHLMLEVGSLVDVYDVVAAESPEEIPISSIFANGATDGEYVLAVALDTEKETDAYVSIYVFVNMYVRT